MNIDGGLVFSYADDTALLFMGNSWDSVFKIAQSGLFKVFKWLQSNLLTLNINKTYASQILKKLIQN